jgi:hypothetical protein
MKTTSNKWLRLLAASLLALFSIAALSAQDAPKVGFIRLVNVVSPGTGNLHLKIDGEEMYAKGYTMGQRTGGIGLLAGSKKITVTKDRPGHVRGNAKGDTIGVLELTSYPDGGLVVNIVPAMLNMRLDHYALATFIGIIPGTFAYAFVGAGLSSVIAAQEAANPGCAQAGTCSIDPQALVTPQLVLAMAALGIAALIPVAYRHWSGRAGRR